MWDKKNKKTLFLMVVLAILVFSIFNTQDYVQGHDPTVILDYYYADQILEVYVFHPVMYWYLDIHYINNIQVRKNGVLVGNYSYDSQPNDDDLTYNYSISAVHFDILKVRVFCTYQGDAEAEIMVLDPDNPTTVPPTPSKLFEVSLVELIILVSIIGTIVSKFRRTRYKKLK